jgi:RimJ/RimL family protein N-acetyltransferase
MTGSSSLAGRPDLTTERLLLRRPYDGDADAIVAIVGDWEVARRLARVPHPYGAEDARFFLDMVVPAEWVWAVTWKGSPELIGVIGLTPGDARDTAELGYWLSPQQWSKGIITEAASAVLAFGFGKLQLRAVTSGHFEENLASGKVLQKLGFEVTGRSMSPCLAAGGEVPAIRMLLERPAWRLDE